MSVTVTIENEIATIRMDDGRANAVNPDVLKAIHAGLDKAEAEAKAVVLTGREGIFSAGFDLNIIRSGDPEAVIGLVSGGGELALRMFSFPLPIVVACTGHGIAMGSFLIAASDYRLGVPGDNYKIGANESAIGMVIPEFASELLAARLDPKRLTESIVFGQLFSPEEAVEIGYLDALADPDKIEATAIATAKQLSELSKGAYAGNKRRVRKSTIEAMEAVLPIPVDSVLSV